MNIFKSELGKFFRRLGIGSAILFLLASPLLWFNIILDPYGVFFDHYEYSSLLVNRRFTKVKYHLNHPSHYQAFIFGSSRINFINPKNIPEDRFFNMHYPSGRPSEHLRDLKMMKEAGVQIKKVILAVDFLSIFLDFPIDESDLLSQPYPSTLKEYYNFYKNYALNIPGNDLISAAITNTAGERAQRIGNGSFSVKWKEEIIEGNPEAHIRDQTFRIPSSNYENSQNISRGLTHLKELVDFLKSQKIGYRLFINPTHVTTYLAFNIDAYLNVLREISEISDFIDFSGLNSVAISNLNFYETSHYREKVGDLIISRLMNKCDSLLPDDFGYCVTRENIDQQIERHHAWLSDYFHAERIDLPTEQTHFTTADAETKNIDFRIMYVNGNQAERDNFAIGSRYVNLSGYAVDRTSIKPLENLAVKVNDQVFPVRIIREIIELGQKYNNPEAKKCGWMAVFPIPESQETIKTQVGLINGGQFTPLGREIGLFRQTGVDTNILLGIKRSESGTEHNIDLINGQRRNDKCVRINSNQLSISGWAVDHPARKAAGLVYIRIGDKLFRTDYGQPRPDVADAYKTPAYENSGWSVEIPAGMIGKGQYDITLVILNYGKTGYYITDNVKDIIIE